MYVYVCVLLKGYENNGTANDESFFTIGKCHTNYATAALLDISSDSYIAIIFVDAIFVTFLFELLLIILSLPTLDSFAHIYSFSLPLSCCCSSSPSPPSFVFLLLRWRAGMVQHWRHGKSWQRGVSLHIRYHFLWCCALWHQSVKWCELVAILLGSFSLRSLLLYFTLFSLFCM